MGIATSIISVSFFGICCFSLCQTQPMCGIYFQPLSQLKAAECVRLASSRPQTPRPVLEVGTGFPTVPLLPGIRATFGFLEWSRISSGQNAIAWSWASWLTSLLYLLPQLHHKPHWALRGSVISFSGSALLWGSCCCSVVCFIAWLLITSLLWSSIMGPMEPCIGLSWVQWSSFDLGLLMQFDCRPQGLCSSILGPFSAVLPSWP